jgi:hypothetical protein
MYLIRVGGGVGLDGPANAALSDVPAASIGSAASNGSAASIGSAPSTASAVSAGSAADEEEAVEAPRPGRQRRVRRRIGWLVFLLLILVAAAAFIIKENYFSPPREIKLLVPINTSKDSLTDTVAAVATDTAATTRPSGFAAPADTAARPAKAAAPTAGKVTGRALPKDTVGKGVKDTTVRAQQP